MTSARFRFPVLAGDASESVVTVVAFVLDLEERVETAAAVGGLGALFGGMMETLWIRVVRMLVMMSVDGSKEIEERKSNSGGIESCEAQTA